MDSSVGVFVNRITPFDLSISAMQCLLLRSQGCWRVLFLWASSVPVKRQANTVTNTLTAADQEYLTQPLSYPVWIYEDCVDMLELTAGAVP